jgi:hypothetical protein
MTSTEILRWRREWSAATKALWADLCAARQPTLARQEAFQLLAAAVVYHMNGVRSLDDAAIHRVAVSASSAVPWDASRYSALFDSARLPCFGSRAARGRSADFYGGMHLASASLRIPTAVTLLARHAGSEFHTYLNKHQELNRGKLLPELKRARAGCAPLANPRDRTLLAYHLALVVAERDRMEHGAESAGAGWWSERERAFSQLNQCQVVEAQLSVIRIALDDLVALGG